MTRRCLHCQVVQLMNDEPGRVLGDDIGDLAQVIAELITLYPDPLDRQRELLRLAKNLPIMVAEAEKERFGLAS